MQPYRTKPTATLARTAIAGALAVTVLAASGCGWFRKGDALYAGSPESRPLEVPPDLDRPDTAGAMALPSAPASVSRSSMAAPAPQAVAASATGFTVAMERDAAFARVGEVLAGTSGATVMSKAEILGTYDIDYDGSKFLVRVTKVDGGSYVSAVDPRGLPATGEAPVRLMASLRSALGG